jgi:hypothetical protein
MKINSNGGFWLDDDFGVEKKANPKMAASSSRRGPEARDDHAPKQPPQPVLREDFPSSKIPADPEDCDDDDESSDDATASTSHYSTEAPVVPAVAIIENATVDSEESDDETLPSSGDDDDDDDDDDSLESLPSDTVELFKDISALTLHAEEFPNDGSVHDVPDYSNLLFGVQPYVKQEESKEEKITRALEDRELIDFLVDLCSQSS